MKNALFIISGMIAIISIQSCQKTEVKTKTITHIDKQPKEIAKVEWLVGRWEDQSSEGHTIEEWKKVNDSTLQGMGIVIVKNDTVFREDMKLVQEGNSLHYKVMVNNEPEVIFTHNPADTISFKFVNPDHEAPSVIEYCKPHGDTLEAAIYHKNGQKMQGFKMRKVK